MYTIPVSVPASIEGTAQLIPRVIYQTFKSTEVTDRMYYASQTWTQYNPDYSYEYYDDLRRDEYVKNFNCEGLNFTNEELNRAYNSIKPQAGKADIWRYLILYEKGGVYTDIDTICKVPLSNYIEPDDTVVTRVFGECRGLGQNPDPIKAGTLFTRWYHLFVQLFMIYTAKNPFIKITLEACIHAINTRTPVPGSEDCENLLERYTGPCTLNYGVRQVLKLSKNEELRVKKSGYILVPELNEKIHQIDIFSKIDAKYQGYEQDIAKDQVRHWRFENIFVND
jgi:mannosyltransferase OCH1-like enzyme